MLKLPAGYAAGKYGETRRAVKRADAALLGDEWTIGVYYNGAHAFELTKQYVSYGQPPVYSGRTRNSEWQQFASLPEAIRVMCARHKLGVP